MNFLKLIVFVIILNGCNTSRVYIVRHAEKSTVPENDPHLSNEGKLRAEYLKEYLREKHIQAIYSTEKARTVETATPLSSRIHVPVQYYGNDTLENFLNSVFRSKKNTLIVGHSNTSVAMLNIIDLPHNTTFIPETEYNNLFIIKVKKGKPVKISELKYGITVPAVK